MSDDRPPDIASIPSLIPRQEGPSISLYPTSPPTTTTITNDDLNGSNSSTEPLLSPSNRGVVLTSWQIAIIISGSFLLLGICGTAWILLRTRVQLRRTGGGTLSVFGFGLSNESRQRRRGRTGSRTLGSGEDLESSAIGKTVEGEDHSLEGVGHASDKPKRDKGTKAVETKVRLSRLEKKQSRASTGPMAPPTCIQTSVADTGGVPLPTDHDYHPPSSAQSTTQLQQQHHPQGYEHPIHDRVGPYRGPPIRRSEDWGWRSDSVAHTIRGSFENEREDGEEEEYHVHAHVRPPISTFDPVYQPTPGPQSLESTFSGGDHSSPPIGSSLLGEASPSSRRLAFSGPGLFGPGIYRTDHERPI